MLTFEQQTKLVADGLATVRVEGYLSTFKYHRKVMYNNRNGKLV